MSIGILDCLKRKRDICVKAIITSQNTAFMLTPALSPGQTIATCQRNISQHRWAQHVACVWPPCCDMLPRRVGCCWLKFNHFQTWANNTQNVATHRNRVAKRTQHVAPNNVAICCVGMLRSFGRGNLHTTPAIQWKWPWPSCITRMIWFREFHTMYWVSSTVFNTSHPRLL